MSYDEWEEHYSSYDAPALVAEALTFDSSVPVLRMGAFVVRLVRLATEDRQMDYEERLKAAGLAVTAGKMIKNIEGVGKALRKTLENQRTFGLYPAIASVIEEGIFDQQNPVGQILSHLEPYEVDLLETLIARGGMSSMSGNRDHRKFDRLERLGYIERRAVAMDTVQYEVTTQGREAVKS